MSQGDIRFLSGILAPTVQAMMFLASAAHTAKVLNEHDAQGLADCMKKIAGLIEPGDDLPGDLAVTLNSLATRLTAQS